jgi:hypothetical protein
MCILTLDGHSQQGCEAYAVLMSAKNGRGGADFGDAGVAWNSYGWAVVQVEPEPDEAGMSMPDSFTFTLSPRMSSIEAMFSHFFQTVPGKGPPVGATAHRPKSAVCKPTVYTSRFEFWYHFIVSRASIWQQSIHVGLSPVRQFARGTRLSCLLGWSMRLGRS